MKVSKNMMEAARRTYVKWHDFEPRSVIDIDIPVPKGELVDLGEMTQLDYVSDKWENQDNHYYHEFEKNRPHLLEDGNGNLFIQGNIRVTAGLDTNYSLGIEDWESAQDFGMPRKPPTAAAKLGRLRMIEYTDSVDGETKTLNFRNEVRYFCGDPQEDWCYISSPVRKNPQRRKNPREGTWQNTYRVPLDDLEAMKAIGYLRSFTKNIGVYVDPDRDPAKVKLTLSGLGGMALPKVLHKYRHNYKDWIPWREPGTYEALEYRVVRRGDRNKPGIIEYQGEAYVATEFGDGYVPVEGEISTDQPLPKDPKEREAVVKELIVDSVEEDLSEMTFENPSTIRQKVHDVLKAAGLPLGALHKGHAQYEAAMQILVDKLPWDAIQRIDSALVRNPKKNLKVSLRGLSLLPPSHDRHHHMFGKGNPVERDPFESYDNDDLGDIKNYRNENPRTDDQLYEDLLMLSKDRWIRTYDKLIDTCKKEGYVITDDAIHIDILQNIHSHYLEYVKARYHPMEIAAKVIKEITASKPREDRKRDLPFGDGNRRTSVKIASAILEICGYQLEVSDAHAERFRDEVRSLSEEEVVKFLKHHCIALSNPKCSLSQRSLNSLNHISNSSSDIYDNNGSQAIKNYRPNPRRVRYDRGSLESATEAAKRLDGGPYYIFGTYYGYTINNSKPPPTQSYRKINADGTYEDVHPTFGPKSNPAEEVRRKKFITTMIREFQEQYPDYMESMDNMGVHFHIYYNDGTCKHISANNYKGEPIDLRNVKNIAYFDAETAKDFFNDNLPDIDPLEMMENPRTED